MFRNTVAWNAIVPFSKSLWKTPNREEKYESYLASSGGLWILLWGSGHHFQCNLWTKAQKRGWWNRRILKLLQSIMTFIWFWRGIISAKLRKNASQMSLGVWGKKNTTPAANTFQASGFQTRSLWVTSLSIVGCWCVNSQQFLTAL